MKKYRYFVVFMYHQRSKLCTGSTTVDRSVPLDSAAAIKELQSDYEKSINCTDAVLINMALIKEGYWK